jgi:hypothetical protein
VLLQLEHHFERALRVLFCGERVEIGEARDARHAFVEARVVLHRAGAERVHAEVYVVVPRRDAREVAHHVHLGEFRHAFEVVPAAQLGRQKLIERCLVHVERGQHVAAPPCLRALEDKRLVLRDVRRGLRSHSSKFKVQSSKSGAGLRLDAQSATANFPRGG